MVPIGMPNVLLFSPKTNVDTSNKRNKYVVNQKQEPFWWCQFKRTFCCQFCCFLFQSKPTSSWLFLQYQYIFWTSHYSGKMHGKYINVWKLDYCVRSSLLTLYINCSNYILAVKLVYFHECSFWFITKLQKSYFYY